MKIFTLFFVFFSVAFISVATMAQTDFWEKIDGPFGDTITTLGINASGTIFLGTNLGVFSSTDNGVTWTERNSGLDFLIDFAFNSMGTIFCAGNGGVFRSTDNGTNWTKIYNQEPIKTIAINESGHIFMGWGHETGGGVERSMDNGASWINTGLEANSYAIAINASGTIFSGGWNSNGGCVFRSTDNGASWTNTGIGLSALNVVNNLEISPAGHIFAGTSEEDVYRSTDNGEHWIPSNLMTSSVLTAFAFNSIGHIFAGTYGEGVSRSIDDGETWTTVNSGLTNDSVLSIAINPSDHIFAATTGGLFRSVQPTTSVKDPSTDAPISFSLNQNYPNPFNPSTTIRYSIPEVSFATIKVYDVLGKEVATLVNEEQSAGSYEVNFNASQLSSGIYFYKISAGNFVETKKMILMK